MRKTLLTIFAIVFLTVSLVSVPFAHPGRTDAEGGHWDHSTGEYHYHHGYPAHQHIDGVCPYDFDDQTNHGSGSNSDSASSKGSSQKTSEESSKQEENDGLGSTIICVACLSLFALAAFFDDLGTPQSRKRKKVKRTYSSQNPSIRQTPIPKKEWSITNNDHLIQPKTTPPPIEQFSESTRLHYQEKYGGKSRNEIARLCGMPINVYISKENLPCSNDPKAQYTFYISAKGNAYHKKEGCSNAFIKVNAASLVAHHPCKICKPVRPDLLWFHKYLNVLEQLRKYKIDIKD